MSLFSLPSPRTSGASHRSLRNRHPLRFCALRRQRKGQQRHAAAPEGLYSKPSTAANRLLQQNRHETAVPIATTNVRSWWKSGPDLLVTRLSHFDPTEGPSVERENHRMASQSASSWNQREAGAVLGYERFIKLASQSSITRPALPQSQAAYAGA